MPNDLSSLLAASQDIRGPASIDAAIQALQPQAASLLQGVGPAPQVPAAPAALPPQTSAVAPGPMPSEPIPTTSGLALDAETRLALISRLDSLKASLLSTPTIDPEIVSEVSSISSLINPESSGVPLP